MSLSHYNPSDRYRQRSLHRILGVLRFLLIVILSGGLGFWIGNLYAGQGVMTLKAERDVLAQQRDSLQENVTRIRAEAQTANARLEQVQETYEETIPEGPMRDLITLVKKQLDEGMDPQRLSVAIQSARPPRNCSEIETKRFVVSTPAYEGPDSEISVAENMISISGKGSSAHNDKGQPEAWYDSSQIVRLVFTVVGGKQKKVNGVMPLHHSVISGDREYRFTISEGARSFAKVTFDSCDYP
ncbi:MAG: hypothetical protein DHS20C02_06950 [Micavibrio sp.]|nr:MAG: hypothetical protein DHS20C02_06950 [Micavibrio sp.]